MGCGSFLSMYTVRAGCMMRPAGIQLPIKPALPRLFHCCLDPHHAGHYNTHTIIPWACSKVFHLSDTHITMLAKVVSPVKCRLNLFVLREVAVHRAWLLCSPGRCTVSPWSPLEATRNLHSHGHFLSHSAAVTVQLCMLDTQLLRSPSVSCVQFSRLLVVWPSRTLITKAPQQ